MSHELTATQPFLESSNWFHHLQQPDPRAGEGAGSWVSTISNGLCAMHRAGPLTIHLPPVSLLKENELLTHPKKQGTKGSNKFKIAIINLKERCPTKSSSHFKRLLSFLTIKLGAR